MAIDISAIDPSKTSKSIAPPTISFAPDLFQYVCKNSLRRTKDQEDLEKDIESERFWNVYI